MSFVEMCEDIFKTTSKYHNLSKDVLNLNTAIYYLNNFYSVNRKEIEQFIVDVRQDNPISTLLFQGLRAMYNALPMRKLEELSLGELYYELQGETKNLKLKGAYDSFLLFNDLNEQQRHELAMRIANEDISIFGKYRSK